MADNSVSKSQYSKKGFLRRAVSVAHINWQVSYAGGNFMSEEIFFCLDELSSKNILNDYELECLEKYSKNDDYEIRMKVAEILIISKTKKSKKILLDLTNDKNYLVRANACESLSIFSDKETLMLLINVARRDKSCIVRAYAVLSARDIALNLDEEAKRFVVKYLEHLVINETCRMIHVAAYSGLYLLCDNKYINNIFDELNSKRYQLRCFAVNILLDITDSSNKDIILKRLRDLYETEKTVAVKSALTYAIERLCDSGEEPLSRR